MGFFSVSLKTPQDQSINEMQACEKDFPAPAAWCELLGMSSPLIHCRPFTRLAPSQPLLLPSSHQWSRERSVGPYKLLLNVWSWNHSQVYIKLEWKETEATQDWIRNWRKMKEQWKNNAFAPSLLNSIHFKAVMGFGKMPWSPVVWKWAEGRVWIMEGKRMLKKIIFYAFTGKINSCALDPVNFCLVEMSLRR